MHPNFKSMKHKILFIGISLVLLAHTVLAQQIIKGKVKDAQTNEALVGASVSWAAMPTKGVITDQAGRFSLEISGDVKNIEISFVGYRTLSIAVKENQSSMEVLLEPTNLQLTEVIVTGYDSKRKLLDATGSISLVTERDIARNNSTNLSQLMNHIPGLQVRGSQSLRSTSISIRGMGSRGPGASGRVKIYLNDIALTYADGSNAFEDVDAQTIGKIEVIKGPASSIYGSSVGGVLNISTQKAQYGENSAEASGMVQSFGTWRVSNTYRYSNDKVNLYAQYGEQATNGYRDFNAEHRKWLTFFGQFFLTNNVSTTVFINRNRYDARAPGALTPEQVAQNPRQYQQYPVDSRLQNSGRNILFTRIGISNEWQMSAKWQNITTVSLAGSDLDHPTPQTYIYNWIQNQNARTRFVYSDQLFGLQTRLTFGAEYNRMNNRLNFLGNRNGVPSTPGFFSADRVALAGNTVLFAQAETNLTPTTLLAAGVSANYYTYESLNFLFARPVNPQNPPAQFRTVRRFDPYYAPRLGLNQRITSKIAAHASISYGFSPPSTGDINNGDGTENPNLNPETGVNYEVGLRGSAIGDRLGFDVAVYRMNMDNEILTRTPQVGVSVRENAGSTSYQGIDLYLSYLMVRNPNGWLTLLRPYVSYTYLDSKFVNFVENPRPDVFNDFGGRNLPSNVPNRVFAGLEAETKTGFYGFATFEWIDRTPVNNANTLFNESYSVLNGKAGYRKKLGRFAVDVYAGMDNAFNTTYTESVSVNPAAQSATIGTGANVSPNPIAGQFPFLNPNWGRNYYGGASLKYFFDRK